MKKLLRVVLDTNVFISSFILAKEPHLIVEAWRKDVFLWILSPQIQEEYVSVISRSKFHLTKEEIEDVMALLETAVAMKVIEKVEPTIKLAVVKEDPQDNIFLECAITGQAGMIVTGDKHLLNLKAYKDVSILSLSSFLKILAGNL